MISRSLALGLLAAGCVAAAGGGAYVAVRQNTAEPAPAAVSTLPTPMPQQPVSETEAVVAPDTPAPNVAVERSAVAPSVGETPAAASKIERPRNPRVTRRDDRPARAAAAGPSTSTTPAGPRASPAPTASSQVEQPRETPPVAAVEPVPEPARAEPPAPTEPQFEEVTVPASSVIGLQIDTPVTTDRAQVEDRVSARVTRDVMAHGRVAIPAGSRVLGSVTLVERGGKVKERARLGVRFHTLVLADGSEIPLRTEPIFREGDSPAGSSSRKIGGAAVGGAIIGAILGGGKGAVIGGATGAAGGTAAVMAGDRHAATLPNGAIVTARLSSPVDIQVEKH